MLKQALLAFALLLPAISCRAQQAPPQIRIVDVMPTIDPGTIPQTPLVSLDFLIGAWPHPSWWGRPWRTSSLEGPEFPSLRDFKGQLTAPSAQGPSSLS